MEASSESLSDPGVSHALLVAHSLLANDFPSFFRLYQAAPNMNAHVMETFVGRVRFLAFQTLCKG